MIGEVSAGGVVIFGNALLLLKKFNGDYVLPKGRMEKGESLEETALREVEEEAGIKAEIVEYIGDASYEYRNYKYNEFIEKTVHWYLMSASNMDGVPQKSEGFIEATFVHMDRARDMVRYEDERRIIDMGLKILKTLK